MKDKIKNGQLRVWWIPQIPMKPFHVMVNNLAEAKLLLDTLADYDIFQYENKVKPDYCNTGGLEIWNDDPEIWGDNNEENENGEKWIDWYDEESGDDFDEYCENNNIRGN